MAAKIFIPKSVLPSGVLVKRVQNAAVVRVPVFSKFFRKVFLHAQHGHDIDQLRFLPDFFRRRMRKAVCDRAAEKAICKFAVFEIMIFLHGRKGCGGLLQA